MEESPTNKLDISGVSDYGSSARVPYFQNSGFCRRLYYWCRRKQQYSLPYRVVKSNRRIDPPISNDNHIKNTKYNIITFLPKFLYDQFKYFFNFYYLCLCLSQFYDPLKIGFLFTYIGPLAFVLFLSMFNEIVDEVTKFMRDWEANKEQYDVLDKDGQTKMIRAGDLKVGDLVILEEGRRAPADMIILSTKYA